MTTYKYILDKSSRKFQCPNCNQKKLVRYIDTETNNYLSDDFGKCDRLDNCQYHKAPPKGTKAYLIHCLAIKCYTDKTVLITDTLGMKHYVPKSQVIEQNGNDIWLTEFHLKKAKIYYLSNESKYFNTNNEAFINEVRLMPAPPLKPPTYHSLELLQKLIIDEPMCDNLSQFLLTIFSHEQVQELKAKYLLSGTNYHWNNSTMFWQIDDKEQIHACKIMQYNALTGKRIKKPYNRINWLHKALKLDDFVLNLCLFGLHRINEDHTKTIAIVESEKTAMIMSLYVPDYIWLATGSKQNLKIELLQPIKHRNIILFPDKGEYNNWFDKATELNRQYFKINVSDLIENNDNENVSDLADLYLLNR
jgi:hypothetical protein